MALRGNLRDFSLPDVFQLITFSRKTGVLRIVRSDDASGSVWFNEGEVFFASSNWRTRPLGERLVNSQRITPQALARALELRALEPDNGRRLGQILVDEAYITQKVLESFVQEQIQDTIFDLMRWDEGDFDFEPMPAVVEEDIGLSVSIENIVMEGSRRLEEWARIKKKIPSMDVVFKMATAPGEGSFEISLKPMEWELLVLVDGSRSVAELAVSTNRTDFEVARVIYGLFSAGLLEFATDEEVARNREERAAREAAFLAAMPPQADVVEVEPIPIEPPVAEIHTLTVESDDHEVVASGHHDAELVQLNATESVAYSGPAEVPQFLDSAGVSAPTHEDQAVLEEFMGSLLGVVGPTAAVPAPQDTPPQTPYAPSEEPAFIGSSVVQPSEGVIVPSVEELLGSVPTVETEPAAKAESSAEPVSAGTSAFVVEPEPVLVPEQVLEPEAEPEAESEAETESAVPATAQAATVPNEPALAESVADPADPSTGDELPSAVATDPSIQYPLIPVAPLADVASERLSIVDSLDQAAPSTPMSLSGSTQDAAGSEDGAHQGAVPDFARDLMALGLGELPVEEPASDSSPAAEMITVHDTISRDDIADDGASIESSGDLDVSGIIESLGEHEAEADSAPDAPALLGGVASDDVADQDASDGFDRDLIEESTDRAPSGVISTDGFLSSGLTGGLSSGLNDELSALTGAERRTAHPRPQASVKPLGVVGGIRRDPRVDRETLLKIIDGLERL